MDINKIIFIIAVIYISICIGTFIRCKSYGMSNNISACFLIAVPPILFCFIFFLPLLLIKKKNTENISHYLKKYFKIVSLMLKLIPLIVTGIGLCCEGLVNKITGKNNTFNKDIYFKNIYSELKAYVV